MDLTNQHNRLRVALLSINPRTQALLDYFFLSTGRSAFQPCDENQAEAAIFDFDHPESRLHWERFHSQRGLPGIVVSILEQHLPYTVWVPKPVAPAALLTAAARVRQGAWEAPPQSAPPVAVVPPPPPAPEIQTPLAEPVTVAPPQPETPPLVAVDSTTATTPASVVPVVPVAPVAPVAASPVLVTATPLPPEVPAEPVRPVAPAVQEPAESHTHEHPHAPELVKKAANALFGRLSRWLHHDQHEENNAQAATPAAPVAPPAAPVVAAAPVTAPAPVVAPVTASAEPPQAAAPVMPVPPAVAENIVAPAAEIVPVTPALPVTVMPPEAVVVVPPVVAVTEPAPAAVPAVVAAPVITPAQPVAEVAAPVVPTPAVTVPPVAAETPAEAVVPEPAVAPPAPVAEAEVPPTQPVRRPPPTATLVARTPDPVAPASAPVAPEPVVHHATTSELETEKQFCGDREDMTAQEIHDSRELHYNPADYLLAALKEAYLVGGKWRVPAHVDFEHGGITYIPETNQAYLEFPETDLAAHCAKPLPKFLKVRMVSKSELPALKKKFASGVMLERFDARLWRVGLETAQGRLPKGTDVKKTIYLKHWPNLTRIQMTPHAMRIAALWATRGASLLDTAEMLKVPQRHVFAFYNAAFALDLVTDNGAHIKRAQKRAHRSQNVFSRLFKWLRT